MSILSKSGANSTNISPMIRYFFRELEIPKLLRKCNFNKERGVPVIELFLVLFQLAFKNMNLYRSIETGGTSLKKDTAYRFLNSCRYNWRKFVLLLGSTAITRFIAPLTSEDRVKVLVIDDSYYDRSRSKKVELLSKVYDHVTGKYVKGFRMLTLGWSDGATFMPISFSLLSSRKEKNRIQEISESIDKRCNGYKRRAEALCKATDMAVELVRQGLKHKIPASYVLFDSWFAFPVVISRVRDLGINVIARLKKTSKVFYIYNGRHMSLESLYNVAEKKKPNPENILASVQAELRDSAGELFPVRIVFVRKRSKNKKETEWLAILSTDTSLPDKEISRIYGYRWDIEVFFKSSKSLLRLAKEFQGRSYDLLVAHTSIVFTRYIMLALQSRHDKDTRSCGELFYRCCKEIQDVTLVSSLVLILSVLQDSVQAVLDITEEKFNEIFRLFKSLLPEQLQSVYTISNCES